MNKKFISYLSNKLKTGNLNSIHLNALPGRLATRLDLSKLDIISGLDAENQLFETENEQISNDFLFNNLLAKAKFQYKINFDNVPFKELDEQIKKKYELISRKLNSIVNQEEDSYLEHGIKTFSFGYPLLIKRSKKEPNKIIKAPVMIWSLDIKRSDSKQNEWIIDQIEESPIYINEVLISHFANDENIIINDLPTDFLEDSLIDEHEIIEIVNEILKKFNANVDLEKLKIETCPDKEIIENKTGDKPWILWSGVFGLFKTQKQSIIKDADNLVEHFENYGFEEIQPESFRASHNTSVPTDPSQEEIINTIDHKEYKVIQGPPGTGKSQSLTAIITNTLENGRKILVVCEKKTALDVIYNNLKKLGLDKLIAIIDDVNRDRKHIIDTVRTIAETNKKEIRSFNESDYDNKLQKYHELISDFNNRHHNLLKAVFKGYNVQEMISEYLNLKKTVEKNDRLLQDVDFEYKDEEFNNLITLIEQAADLYEEIPEQAFVYNVLSKENFTEQYSIPHENQTIERINSEIDFLNNIETSYFDLAETNIEKLPHDLLQTFKLEIIDNYSFNIQSVLTFWKNLSAELQKNHLHFSNSELLNSTTLSTKIDEFHSLYDNISTHIALLTSIEEGLYLISLAHDKLPDDARGKIDFKSSGKLKSLISKKHKAIQIFQHVLKKEYNKINKTISENAMNNTNINLLDIIKGFLPIQNDIDDLVQDLKLCVESKKWFKEYHHWRNFYDVLEDLPFECITKLSDYSGPKEWKEVFRLNYFNLFIESQAGNNDLYNYNSKTLERIGELQDELKALHRHKILKLWEDKSYQSIRAFNERSNIKWLFNYRKNTQYARKNTLRSILHDEFELFTDVFPVVLVNPVVCSSILPLQQHLFEIVLFDEASQLRLEDTYPALVRGKIKVISGDKHQMPPSNYFASDISLDITQEAEENESPKSDFDKSNPLYLAESESLLDFGNSLNPNTINISFLDYHYRSKHPYLIDFSNIAFYGGRLIPMPEKNTYKPIRFFNVSGLYRTDNTNLDEALHIIDYLKNKYPVNKDGGYPSLGIATFNMQQRNLLKDLINDECIKDEEFRAKMNLIGKSEEWFVKNLENIQGDERDIIMISTTFGKNNVGKFRQNFGPLNTAKGYKLLNVIITRAKKQLYLFTSIPEEYFNSKYQDEIINNGNKGKAILYAYLDYCRAIENDNEEQRLSILKTLQQGCEEDAYENEQQTLASSFEQEVYDYLSCFIKPDRFVSQYKLGGYLIDFVLLNENQKPIIAIECDGAYWHNTEQAYSHDLHREKILESQGLKFYRIWSKSWWPDPGKEIEKLLQFVEETDKTILIETEKDEDKKIVT